MPEWAEEFSEFLLLTGQQHADVRTKCTLIKKSCKKAFLQRQVKTAIRKSSSWGDFLKTLEQMYPVYKTDLSVRTEIEELPPLPEFPTAARISEFVAQLEELMGRMNPSSYGPTERHLWLVGKIPPRTWENCKQTSERKSRTHSYDELVDLLIKLAMERENDSGMEKYLRKHLRREAPAEKPQGGRSPQPHSNPGKGKGGQLKHMKETPPAKGKGAPDLFYCQTTDDERGPCHAPDCDGRSSCMLKLRQKQKTKDGQEVKHQDHFRCTITCGYCGKRRHYEDECHMKRRESEKLRKAEEEQTLDLHVLSGPYSTALLASTVTQDLDWLHPDPLDAKLESTPRGVCSYPRCGCNAAWRQLIGLLRVDIQCPHWHARQASRVS